MIGDFRHALRLLAKSPGFTAIAVATLAIGIGLNAAVFTVVDAAILRPLVKERPEQVVNLFTARAGATRDYRQFSHAEYEVLRESRDTFADVAAVQFTLAGVGREGAMRRTFTFLVSDNYFRLLGVQPVMGRFFTADETRPNAARQVVVVSYAFWRRSGGSPSFIGSTITINSRPFTVIGVAPKGFNGLNAFLSPDVWVPLGAYSMFGAVFGDSEVRRDLSNPRNYTLNLTARLADGVSQSTLGARLPALMERLDAIQVERGPDQRRDLQFESPTRFSISTNPSADGSTTFLIVAVFTMAGCVLLIASINLANMLLARGSARAKEIALRTALGASRWRIVRQLLIEGLVLAFAGGSLGLLLSTWANDFLLRSLDSVFGAMNFSVGLTLDPDLRVVLVTALLSGFATLLFSLGPALKASKVDLVHELKQQGGEPSAVGRLTRFFAPRHCLVMAQIALSLVLLFASGLFVRGAMNASGRDLGFDPSRSVVAELDFGLAGTPSGAARDRMFQSIERVRAVPGVDNAALATMVPYGNYTSMTRVVPAQESTTREPGAPEPGVNALYCATTPGYFDVVGVRLLQGRDFTEVEARDKSAPRVAIIDEVLARRLFPNESAVGQRIRYTQPRTDGSPSEMEVVGVCATHRHDVLDQPDRSRVFVPLSAVSGNSVYLHVRSAAGTPQAVAGLVAPLRKSLLEWDPALPLLRIEPFEAVVGRNVGLWVVRIGAVLFGIFGGVALLLAAVGVYGVKAYTVSRRTREIGIRMALGAEPRAVFSLVMTQSVLQTAFALALGVLLSLVTGRLLGQLLYEVSPADPYAMMGAVTVLTGSALLATFVPARRAALVDPMVALRAE